MIDHIEYMKSARIGETLAAMSVEEWDHFTEYMELMLLQYLDHVPDSSMELTLDEARMTCYWALNIRRIMDQPARRLALRDSAKAAS